VKLARTLRLDESDTFVFDPVAEAGEWAISGGFAFSNWTEADLKGKARQAFANGWLGLDTFGRATFVAVTPITEAEYEAAIATLAHHFVSAWGAPSQEAAWPVAEQELNHMREMCEDHPDNTLMVVARELNAAGVHETYRTITTQDAGLESFAVHGALDDPNG